MSYKIKISPTAHEDIRGIYDYVLKDGESIASNQVDEIYDALSALSEFPLIGKELSSYVARKTDYRYIVIRKLYLAFYKIEIDEIKVLRIFRKDVDYIAKLRLK